MYTKTAAALLDFIHNSPTAFHVVDNLTKMLEGFTPLSEGEEWTLESGKGYYVTRNGSSLIAFRLPEGELTGFHIAAAHSDSPVFKLKPQPEIRERGYVKLNVEKYGGMLCAPWLDRPLSVAGRLVVRDGEGMAVKLVNVDRDLAIIPNLAIHMNRSVNDGMAYNPQTDLLPIYALGEGETILSLIAGEAGVQEQDILDYDLYLYNRMEGSIWGAKGEFISSRSLDDLQCAWPLVKGLTLADKSKHWGAVCCVFDNEEVGSASRQGAASTFLPDVVERICDALGLGVQQSKAVISRSFLISADNAHAVHPNHPEKADPTNQPKLNEGIVIKYNAALHYTTDALSSARFKLLCEKAGVSVQSYTNRSDITGGSTLGCIALRKLGVSTVDIGLAQLAMHSPYETAGVQDTESLLRVMEHYYGDEELIGVQP
jgi:aspartyl aminopeptidase